ncbi:MAG: hypothetical protein KR126chlam4_00573 [Candidatus Anoxychlamydiales bacterium]|nr:hypothetical protein [Candidatus Anoxychlamydiales bacterium]NGX40742.1 hypothetical protein [Candidatus Anoxychlamydiales bacterium]HEU64938.1 hypothetical protein [Chlamydiota bacterium]
MALFKNFIIVVIVVGILTRIALYLYSRKFKKDMAIFLAFFTVSVIILPIVSLTLGFDIAVSEYVVALVIWLLFDLMRIKITTKKMKK